VKHNENRKTYFSGYRSRRFDTRMGTMYLMVPKLRQGGYVPFFVTAKKRNEEMPLGTLYEKIHSNKGVVSTAMGLRWMAKEKYWL